MHFDLHDAFKQQFNSPNCKSFIKPLLSRRKGPLKIQQKSLPVEFDKIQSVWSSEALDDAIDNGKSK